MHIPRRQFLGTALAAGAAMASPLFSRAAEEKAPRGPKWLADLPLEPATPLENPPKLSPLLVDAAGRPITTPAGWEARRKEVDAQWREFLGPPPAERKSAPKLTVLYGDSRDGVIRQRVQYDIEPGITTEAYLLKPLKISDKAPGVVVLHSTVDHSILQPAGLGKDAEKAFGLKLAKKGMVAFCPRNFLWPRNHGLAAKDEAAKFLARRPRSLGMAKMLYDSQVATDILASLPEVDADRLGCVGHSLGAKEVLYLMAFDERVKAGIFSEGGVGFPHTNWQDAWYLGPKIKEPGFPREHHELLALAAPRPLLVIGGDSADGEQTWPWITAARPVYELLGHPRQLAFYNHKKGHAVPPEAEEKIDSWLDAFL